MGAWRIEGVSIRSIPRQSGIGNECSEGMGGREP